MIYLNNQPINVTMFPDNTSQVWKLDEWVLNETDYAYVVWDFSNEREFLHLAQLKCLLDSHNFTACLKIKYLPYARQDKEVSNTSTFALHSFAYLLNGLHFEEVIIEDPHSEEALKLIERSRDIYPTEQVTDLLCELETNLICYPDKGALTKYSKMYPVFPYIYGNKIRDQLTGNITSYQVVGDCEGQNVLILDDICDGGATFRLLAKDLLTAGAKEVNLFVTHGIFCKGTRGLFESGIKRIFTKKGEVTERTPTLQL